MSRIVSIIIPVLMLAVCLSPVAVSANPAMPDEGPAFVAQQTPEVGATAALAVNLTSGLQMYEKNGDTLVAPASTMKIVTVLVALTVLNPDEQITITESDLYLGEDYSQMGLMPGDVATVEALVYGAMLASGADATLALARVAGARLDSSASDPVRRFVDEMNEWVVAHNMLGTHFTNPVGIDDPQHFTTARDMVRATEQALQQPLVSRALTTPETVVNVAGPNPRELYLVSTNQLVLSGEALGGKTGTEDLAGECLISIFRRGDQIVVSVVMGSQDRYADTYALLDHVDQRYRFVTLGAPGTVPGLTEQINAQGLWLPVWHTVVMTPEQADALGYELELSGQSSPNGKAGTVIFSTGGREVLRLPVHTND